MDTQERKDKLMKQKILIYELERAILTFAIENIEANYIQEHIYQLAGIMEMFTVTMSCWNAYERALLNNCPKARTEFAQQANETIDWAMERLPVLKFKMKDE